MSSPFAFTPQSAPAGKSKLAMGLGVVVLAALIGFGIYYYTSQKKKASPGKASLKKSSRKSSSKKSSSKSSSLGATQGKGQFQPESAMKGSYANDRKNSQKSESMQAGFAQRMSNINDLGIETTGCAADNYALGPDGGKGQRVEIHNLTPNSFRDDQYKAAEYPETETMDTNWAKHAPTSAQFKTFIRNNSIRHGASDHLINANGRTDNLMRSTNPPMPVSGVQHIFNDSSVRVDTLADYIGDIEGVGDKHCL